ncbi:MAG: LysR family transcriptional regulator [Gammaproteobacteria bacterium]|nr:LysR family transcriptional regulator [Gammaproteobacteria bacterium]MCW8909468.1 LysR family transcriptional regulator [Gammaproteobacteria bacterium]MCW9005660.1 LysR family transcriptional regulator [Gammaproteobacteria bacterium]
MHVTLRQLEVFAAVARHESFTRAAEFLHLSQPGVSMQIKQLENSIGLPLFEHVGKKIFLTDAGREMFAYSQGVSNLLDEAEDVLEELKGVQSGKLAISVATTASHFATRLLAAFSRRYEGVTISLDITNRQSLRHQLERNEPDLVIMGQPPEGLDVESETFMENPLVMIAPANHELIQENNIPLSKFENEHFVVREFGSGTRSAIQRSFDEHGVTFHTGIEMTSNEAIKQAVEAGLGLGIVSIHTLELELETGRLVILDVEDFPIIRHWHIVQRSGKRLSPVAQEFKRFVLQEAEQFIRVPSMQK